eukprot:CAMPEP_0203668668 /NCGR_PEP_ID=MMETSP0090-20130426/5238_1 /ASSEMBLY_ACC=CAM_ASM_001088 /TAXON_ID=426623 /ORGANISM="Chaetoceros affinis, Strain CCMP159" /LENGTH=430 /DNA_ID=CAMNT_0050533167 /DNA_START=163 /DNA_END=1455 /DNA_ORIENTATION=+
MGKSTKATKKRKNTTKKSYQQIDEDNIKEDQHNTSSTSTCRNQGKKKNSHGHQYNKNNKNNKKDKKGTKEKKDDYTFRQKIEHNGEREIIEMTADGNCLFRSISDQIYGDYGQRHDAVRDEICNYLEANGDDFRVYLLLEGSGDNDDVCDFDEYVRQMRKDGEWGGDVEIVCAARLYKRAITIFSNVGAYNVNVDDYGDGNGNGECMTKNPNILLSYHDNMHYNSVHDLTDKDRNSNNNNNNTLQKKRSSVIQSNCTSTSESQLIANSKGKKKKGKKSGSGSKHLGVVDDSKNTTKYSSSQSNGKMDHSAEDNVCINKETMNGENGDGGDGGKNEKEEQVTCEQKLNNSIENSTTSSKNQNVTIKRNDVCPCGSGLRYKKCCLAKEKSRIRLEKFREKHGLNSENNMDDGGCNDSISRTEIEGGFAVLNI